jgi:hypothetical protein
MGPTCLNKSQAAKTPTWASGHHKGVLTITCPVLLAICGRQLCWISISFSKAFCSYVLSFFAAHFRRLYFLHLLKLYENIRNIF